MPNFPRELAIEKNRTLLLEPSILLLCFSEKVNRERLTASLKKLNLEVVDNPGVTHAKGPLINNTNTRIWVRTVDGSAVTADQYGALAKLSSLEWIGPAYQVPGTRQSDIVCVLPHALIVEFRAGVPSVEMGAGLQEVAQRSAMLNGRHYFEVSNPMQQNALVLKDVLLKQFGDQVAAIYFDRMPMISPLAFTPNDTYYTQQWNLTKINASPAWDMTTGNPGVVVAILDTGCDLTHPDLQFASQGVNCSTMMPPGSPAYTAELGHGTCCAGIAAGVINNGQGVSGIAGACKVLPIAIEDFADSDLAFGVNYAVSNGASVISMSWGGSLDSAVLDTALDAALAANVVLCAAAGNFGTSPIIFPAGHPGVMAIDGTDEDDNYKTASSPDGECWQPNFGDGLSVSAPCVHVWSTDIQGAGGFNDNGAAYTDAPCQTYASAGDSAGNYFKYFNGTSAATPHVSGFAALLRSQYNGLSNLQIRNIIERTADKVGSLAYAVNPSYPNGTWNNQLGYGRINVGKGLDFADVYIADFPGDTGVEPRNPPGGDFWDYGDLVVRPSDDDFFNPSLVAQAKTVTRGQTNYIYVRVTNSGPNTARNVAVSVRITPFVGTQFVATDWSATDATHVVPTTVLGTFATLASGTQVIAKFSIDASQVETLYGWETGHPWHPCMLALVTADNDYAFQNDVASGPVLATQINNYAQRNLTVVDTGTMSAQRGFSSAFPFIAGHKTNLETGLGLRIDRSALPLSSVVYLSVDEDGSAFPLVDFNLPASSLECGMLFLERTRIRTKLGCCEGVLVLEKGSRFCCGDVVPPPNVKVVGGMVILSSDGKRLVRIDDPVATVTLSKAPGQLLPLAVQVAATPPLGAYGLVTVAQLDMAGAVVGGAGMAFVTS